VDHDETVLLGRDLLGEHRDVCVVLVRGDEAFDHAELDVHQVLASEGIQYVDFPRIGNAQDLAAVGIVRHA
jgi:hypothetical protein